MTDNQPQIKTIAAIHDLSSFGRCALTVVIPVLSAMGYQVVPLPTALLSTHTGGFENFTFLELTAQMRTAMDHWEQLGLKFDAVYSGFLGSAEQVDIVIDFIGRFGKSDTMILIDPVMGDGGKLYKTITDEIRDKMKNLICHGGILTPNVTEAFFLLDIPVRTQNEELIREMLGRLTDTRADKIVITGIHLDDDEDYVCTASLDLTADGEVKFHTRKRISKHYPGTGDIFSSILLGKLMDGVPLGEAAAFASDFIYDIMIDTEKGNTPERNGVFLETHLYKLIESRQLK